MKTIEVDEDLYRYIASHTQRIGESASDILRRLLNVPVVAGNSKVSARVGNDLAPSVHMQQHVDAIHQLLLSDEYIAISKAVNRFMLILSTLYSLDADSFAAATEILHGRKRVYFAGDQQTLTKNGTHTKPKHVLGTPYWVITNTNSERKRSMIEHIMLAMNFPGELVTEVCSTI